jgi:anti-sigma B factor antagonist
LRLFRQHRGSGKPGAGDIAARAEQGRLFVDVRHHDGQATVVAARGELDLGSAPVLEAVLYELIERGAPHVLLDFEAIAFMDAAGLRAVLDARRAALARGYKWVLGARSWQVDRLIRLAGMQKVLVGSKPNV